MLQGGTNARYPAEYMTNKNKKRKREASDQHEPRLVSEIWTERLANGNDDFIVAYRQHFNTRKEVIAV